MKNKFIKVCILIITILLILQPNTVSASIIKYTTSANGVKTFYISSESELSMVLNIAKSSMVDRINIVCSGKMADIPDDIDMRSFYTNKAIKYKRLYQDNVKTNTNKIGVSSGFFIKSIKENKDKTVLLNFIIYYYDSLEQSSYINDKINQAIIDNINTFKNDYEKIYWAYHWIIDNVNLDLRENNNFSAYDGFTNSGTVCCGYATLYSAIVNKLGVDCRYVEGSVYNSKINNHAWNIVKLDGKWYCIDTTWGDHYNADKYFLKTIDEFSLSEYGNHKSTTYDDYINNGDAFADTSYVISDSIISNPISPSVYNIELDVLKNNALDVGEEYEYLLGNKNNVLIEFKSDNPNVAKVNKNGVITGISCGTAIITAYNTELNISQTCEITVR